MNPLYARYFLKIPALLAILAVAACAHQRPTVVDPVTLPPAFSQTGAAALPAEFWQAFVDPELDQLVQRALQHNYSLAAKRQVLAQADAILRQQRAALWPSLDASLGAVRSDGGDAGASTTTYSGGLAAAYELDLWGRVRSAASAAQWERDATAEDLKAAEITLAADVSSLWYQLVAQRSLYRLQQQQLDTNDKVLQLITARFQQGQTDAADVLRQRVLLEQNRASLATTASNIAVLQHGMAVLLGVAPGSVLPAADQLPTLPALPTTGLTADWLQQRPDIRSAFLTMEAADERIAAAIANRYPRIDLSASITSSATSSSSLFDDWLENLAANLVLPVIDGGERRAEVSRREAIFSEAFARYQQTILTAVAEVEDALAREQFQRQQLQSLRNKITLNDQVVERLGLRYRAGAVDYLDVLQALTDQQQTRQDLITAQQLLLEYRIALARALATGLQPPQSESPTQVARHESEN